MGRRGPKSFAERIATKAFRPTIVRDQSTIDPEPPEHLQAATKAWWLAVIDDFEIEPHQVRTLQAAAESWDRYQQARSALTEYGLTFQDDKGTIRSRPEIAIERDSRTSYLRAMRELNLEADPPGRA
jgi:phage terminase small subunit